MIYLRLKVRKLPLRGSLSRPKPHSHEQWS